LVSLYNTDILTIMKNILLLNKILCIALLLLVISCNASSQTKDSMENKICIEKIKELYGSGVSYQGPISIKAIEKEYMLTIEKDGKKVTLPFGFINDQWTEIKSKIIKGDKIFKFITDQESWANLAGREGIIVLRGNVVIGQLITTMN
jgi:hypothetical protein